MGIAVPGSEDKSGLRSLGAFGRGRTFAILLRWGAHFCTSVLQFGPPTPTLALSVSSEVKLTSWDSGSSYLRLGCPIPGLTVDEESATSLCSLCAAGLDAGTENHEEHEASSEGLGRDTRNFFLCLSIAAFLFSGPSRHCHVATPSASCRSDTRGKKR
ncbi:hypothetical protein EI94DRAFT_745937 [Lactarius quietus]|nr:hypothetical protein EI94DRAFT_745937 [Lactarius quietus]